MIAQIEGGREVRRPVTLYNLDAIFGVGCRVRSLRRRAVRPLGFQPTIRSTITKGALWEKMPRFDKAKQTVRARTSFA